MSAGASVLFVLPNPTHWLIGTTDTEYAGRPEDVAPEPEDVAYLLERLAEVGVRHTILNFLDFPGTESLELFLSDVLPRFR